MPPHTVRAPARTAKARSAVPSDRAETGQGHWQKNNVDCDTRSDIILKYLTARQIFLVSLCGSGAAHIRRHTDAVRMLAPSRKGGGVGGRHYIPERPAAWRADAKARVAQLLPHFPLCVRRRVLLIARYLHPFSPLIHPPPVILGQKRLF